MKHTSPVTRARSGSQVPPNIKDTDSTAQKELAPDGATKNSEGVQADIESRKQNFLMSIPTALTIVRVFAIPPVAYLVQFPDPLAAAWATVIFVSAAITDWLDGYLARKMVCISSSPAIAAL